MTGVLLHQGVEVFTICCQENLQSYYTLPRAVRLNVLRAMSCTVTTPPFQRMSVSLIKTEFLAGKHCRLREQVHLQESAISTENICHLDRVTKFVNLDEVWNNQTGSGF